jgi:hypothetical protein
MVDLRYDAIGLTAFLRGYVIWSGQLTSGMPVRRLVQELPGIYSPIAGDIRAQACTHEDRESHRTIARSGRRRLLRPGARAPRRIIPTRTVLTVDTERWERIGDIFERLLGAPRAERSTLLDSARQSLWR